MTTVEISDNPEKKDVSRIRAGLNAFNRSVLPSDCRELCVFVRQDGVLIGGACGESMWDWVHIARLWIHPAHRNIGLGSRIMGAVECECRRRGCVGIHLDTFSFQALPFYRKCGFKLFGKIEDHPRGYTQYFLKKLIGSRKAAGKGHTGRRIASDT